MNPYHLFAAIFAFMQLLLCEKINLATLNNYSQFLNFGDKKLRKSEGNVLENVVIKSKIDVLGELFKAQVDSLKAWDRLDVVFLIDASSSVGEQNFQCEIKFVKKFLSDVAVDYNHARVAIITFSSVDQIITHIDEITKPQAENNKCLLLNTQLRKIKYAGGGTHTLGAMREARTIFRAARNDSKKVLFLITDGFSNGGDPVPLASELKQRFAVVIFTIGIQNGNWRELFEISSAPGQHHSFLLDSFAQFESLARRALHVDLRSDDHIPLGVSAPCDGLCGGGGGGSCCDANAVCACGTTSGHYSCVCRPGFYGSGLRGSCNACPVGSYADGPNLCRPCPDPQHSTEPPALGVESCKCRKGFQPDGSGHCKTLTCPRISLPEHAYFVKRNACDNVYNSACGIRCEVGYTLAGTSIRLCQTDGRWSGEDTSCQVRTCPALTAPAHGTISCSHDDLDQVYSPSEASLPVDAVCNVKCEVGRILVGSVQRTCLPLARWDGLRTLCKPIKCPKFPAIKHAIVEPSSCQSGKQNFAKNCSVSCEEGFRLEGAPSYSCVGKHANWLPYVDAVCKDVAPPEITCPANITSTAKSKRKFGTAEWPHPTVKDNSDLELTVWMKPLIKNVTAHKFKIGITKVTYFVQDAAKNENNCSFFVTVQDEEPPMFENCDSPHMFLTSDKTGGSNITWDEPDAFDNSQVVKVTKSRQFGFFPIGTTPVTYKAVDGSGNENICTVNITVELAQCEALPDPVFGRSECSSKDAGMQCVITCQEGYAIPLAQPQIFDNDSVSFMCDHAESIWYNQDGLMFPECSVSEVPKEVNQAGTIRFEVEFDKCNDTKLKELENDLAAALNEHTCLENCTINTNTTCEEDVEEERTNIIKRETGFQEVPHKNKRKGKKKKINIKFQVKGKYVDYTRPLLSPVRGVNFTVTYDRLRFTCPAGFVPRKNRCVQCPKGTFHNATNNRCESCNFGHYNDQLGQSACKPCPTHHSTRKLRSKASNDCKGQCPPGTHARKRALRASRHQPELRQERPTLEPHCRPCPFGQYQPLFGQLRCLPCPGGFTTWSYGAANVSECAPTAQTTCKNHPDVCKKGRCRAEDEFELSCLCLEGFSGPFCDRGAPACAANPCLNGGRCHASAAGFACRCPEGYAGELCEIHVGGCALHCANGGVCVQNDDEQFCACRKGFAGALCEDKLRFCNPGICENNSTCSETGVGFACRCRHGFIGRRCNLLPCDYRPCRPQQICVNDPYGNATRSSYTCACPEGFEGPSCEHKTNFCLSSPCKNGGTCTSMETRFICQCPKLFSGDRCEKQRDCNYTLHFPKFATSDYVKLDGFQNGVTQISACLWLQTDDNFNYGTLLSYATKRFDNAFTLTDYTGLVLYVNNQFAVTDVLLNDGLWHHLCVTWKSTNGSYRLYLDGRVIKSGAKLAVGGEIAANGQMVIGQEQDVLGGRFSQAESFVGKMAFVDVWSKALTVEEVHRHMEDCKNLFFGDIYGWPEIRDNVQGNVVIEKSAFCSLCEQPKSFNGIVRIVNNVAHYTCPKGHRLSTVMYNGGRKCTKAGLWEGVEEPNCRKVYCGHPGQVRNAHLFGHKFYYQDKVTYSCYEGHNMTGSSSLLCTENGTWSPAKPICVGVQCVAFKRPANANLTIISEYSYEDFVDDQSAYEIGTQIEINCMPIANLTGENVLTCQENGTWDFQPPQCIVEIPPSAKPQLKIDCSMDLIPSPPSNGYFVVESLYDAGNGTTNYVEYKCRNGYNLIGDNVTTCIIDGYWTEPNITCSPIICRKPKFKNMLITDETNKDIYSFGNMIKFGCVEGYRMFGDSSIRCLASGKWTRMKGKCSKKSCRQPVVSEFTVIDGESYFYEDQVVLTCPNNQQYTLTCNSYGMWIGDRDESC